LQFRLTYRGKLKVGNSSTREDKQSIRRNFHSQLKCLWGQSPLNEFGFLTDPETIGSDKHVNILSNVGSFQFAPLVSDAHGWNTVANIEILFMRPSEPGNLINHGGDLDNRLKTLFDAMRLPKLEELPDQDAPNSDETPFYVLLKDDALVTSFSVVTDRLLTPTESPNDVELTIYVKMSVTRSSFKNIGVSA
jgi:hypothetical protein